MKKNIILLFIILLGFTPFIVGKSEMKHNLSEYAVDISTKKDKTHTAKSDTISKGKKAYDKIFKDKKYQTAKGYITLHLVEDKLYIEYPINMMDKDLLLSSQLEGVSNLMILNAGKKANNTLFLNISQVDSTILISKKNGMAVSSSKGNTNIKKALTASNISSVIYKTPTVAYNPDSSAIVFDATSFFKGNNDFVVSFDPKPKTDKTILYNVSAEDNYASIRSEMTLEAPTNVPGQTVPISFTVKTTLSLLSTDLMPVRFADSRVGTAVTTVSVFDDSEQGLKQRYVSRRWRLDPVDIELYNKGITVDVVNPIVLYVDTIFPEEYFRGIKKGVEKWNKAFEEIGFKNVISVLPYPSSDTAFNANNNLKYNCIKYVQSQQRNLSKNFLIDPRTGEILNVSMYFPRDMIIDIHSNRLIHTGAVDSRVRDSKLPSDLLEESIAAIMTKEFGYCLGLTDNLAGSSWYDVDSMRSAEFTTKHGLSSTVMDDVLYNLVAQPGDKERGVKLVNTELGVYDLFAIKWLYKPTFENPKSEEKILSEWILTHKDDSRYRFIAKPRPNQIVNDPRGINNMLGNDLLKSTKYTLNNYRYVMSNYYQWIDKPDMPEVYKMLFSEFIFINVLSQLRHYAYPIGGIYIDENNSKNEPVFTAISGKEQRQIVKQGLEEIKKIAWINNKEVFKKSGAFYTDMTNPLIATPLIQMLNRIPILTISNSFTDDPYEVNMFLNDVTSFVTKKFRTGELLDQTDLRMLEWVIQIYNNGVKKVLKADKKDANKEALTASFDGDIQAFSQAPYVTNNTTLEVSFDLRENEDEILENIYKNIDIRYARVDNVEPLFYKNLVDIQKVLNRKKNMTNDPKIKGFCEFYSFEIEKTLRGK